MVLESILPVDKLSKLSSKEIKRLATECKNGKVKVGRMIRNKRYEIQELETKICQNHKDRRRHQELCARVNQLGDEEAGYEVQFKELQKALLKWF